MGEAGWTPGSEPLDTPRQPRLPRIEDLPDGEHGYDRAAVAAAFDAFYRHTAELDATLRTLEAVDSFRKEATSLRADIRALRAAAWGPLPSRHGWAGAYPSRPLPAGRGGWLDVLPRIGVEAAFIILVGVAAGVAGLEATWVILLVLAAWLVVALGEAVAAVARPAAPPARPGLLPARQTVPEPAPTMVGLTDVEEAEELSAGEVEDAREPEMGEGPAGPVERRLRRRLLRRLPRVAETEAPPPVVEAPRHVRVLDGPGSAAGVDPWEQGPDLPAAEEPAAVGLAADVAAEPEVREEPEAAAEPERPATAEDPAEPEAEPEQTAASPEEEPVAEAPEPEPEPTAVSPEEEPVAEAAALERLATADERGKAEDEPVAEEAEPEPVEQQVEAEVDAEEPVAEAIVEAEQSGEPEPELAVGGREETGAPEEERVGPDPEESGRGPVAEAPPTEQAGARPARWRFWRRDEQTVTSPEPERPLPQHVRVVGIEKEVLPEDVDVPWEAPLDEAVEASKDSGREQADPVGGARVGPRRPPAPVRSRRGRR